MLITTGKLQQHYQLSPTMKHSFSLPHRIRGIKKRKLNADIISVLLDPKPECRPFRKGHFFIRIQRFSIKPTT